MDATATRSSRSRCAAAVLVAVILHKALVREYTAGVAHRPMRDDDHHALIHPWLGDDGQAAFYRQIAQADERYTRDIEHQYDQLELPVLIVRGEQDTWIPIDRAHTLATTIPGAELHTVPDAGHLIQLDAPEHLTGVLRDWLARIPR